MRPDPGALVRGQIGPVERFEGRTGARACPTQALWSGVKSVRWSDLRAERAQACAPPGGSDREEIARVQSNFLHKISVGCIFFLTIRKEFFPGLDGQAAEEVAAPCPGSRRSPRSGLRTEGRIMSGGRVWPSGAWRSARGGGARKCWGCWPVGPLASWAFGQLGLWAVGQEVAG